MRLTAITYADGSSLAQVHDLFANVTERTDPSGTVVTNVFDKLNLALVIQPDGIYLREWDKDEVTELGSAAVDIPHEEWHDVLVEFSGTTGDHVVVKQRLNGASDSQSIEADTSVVIGAGDTTERYVGFGVGEKGDYDFKDVQFADDDAVNPPTVEKTITVGALSPRVITTRYNHTGQTVQDAMTGGRTIDYEYNGATGVNDAVDDAGVGRVDASLHEVISGGALSTIIPYGERWGLPDGYGLSAR